MKNGKRLLVSLLAAALVVVGILSASVAFGASGDRTVATVATVATVGGAKFIRNVESSDTSHFAPGTITVSPGTRVTWKYRTTTGEPHTISIVKRSQLPGSFNCPVCGQIAKAHGVVGNGPPKRLRVNKGKPGLDVPGDSLIQLPHKSVSAIVSAKAGTTLYYMCAIHPWMQGRIRVRSAASQPRFTG